MKNLLIMNKFPCAGKSKTRLGKTVGYEESAYVAKLLLEDFVEKASDVCDVTVICPTADKRKFLGEYPNLNVREYSAGLFSQLRDSIWDSYNNGNSGRVVAVTGDIVVSKEEISGWFDDLCKYDLLVGPTKDRRFYQIGFSEKFGDNFIKSPSGRLGIGYFGNVAQGIFSSFPKIKINETKRDIDNIEDVCESVGSEYLPEKTRNYFDFLISKRCL